jgi:hypothetical protein
MQRGARTPLLGTSGILGENHIRYQAEPVTQAPGTINAGTGPGVSR